MGYCSKQKMIDVFGEEELIQLTDRTAAGEIDDTVLTAAIDYASAEIDGYVGSRYQALATTPTMIELVCCNIARYQLYANQPTDHVRQRYEDGISYLKQVAAGKVGLGSDASGNQPAPAKSAHMNSGGRVFSRGSEGLI